MDLTGKTALVTGGGSGIGAAVCRRLVACGAHVFVADIDVPAATHTAAELQTSGGGATPMQLDVSNEEAWREIVRRIVDDRGVLDIVHLNAGITARPKGAAPLDDPLTIDAYDRVMGVNARGVALGVIHTLPLLSGGDGFIAVTASISGVEPYPGDPIYAMSKHAVIGLVTSLVPTLKSRGARIAAVCPGGVDTPLVPPEIRARWEGQTIPLASPDFIADGVLHVYAKARSGSVWMARPEDEGYWEYVPAQLPAKAEQVVRLAESQQP